ncbi:alpha-2 adrenergic receptor [Trichonephila clavipes]|nr:alpha-2 adrenergic receptor [Trichonephila clavipes]
MKIGNNGNLVLGPFDESTPCLMIVLMNCQTKLRINHLTAVKSFAILERIGRKIGGRPEITDTLTPQREFHTFEDQGVANNRRCDSRRRSGQSDHRFHNQGGRQSGSRNGAFTGQNG